MPADSSDYLNAADVSAVFDTTPGALYAQRHRSDPPGALAVKVGRRLFWRRSDLDDWFESQRPALIEKQDAPSDLPDDVVDAVARLIVEAFARRGAE